MVMAESWFGKVILSLSKNPALLAMVIVVGMCFMFMREQQKELKSVRDRNTAAFYQVHEHYEHITRILDGKDGWAVTPSH